MRSRNRTTGPMSALERDSKGHLVLTAAHFGDCVWGGPRIFCGEVLYVLEEVKRVSNNASSQDGFAEFVSASDTVDEVVSCAGLSEEDESLRRA